MSLTKNTKTGRQVSSEPYRSSKLAYLSMLLLIAGVLRFTDVEAAESEKLTLKEAIKYALAANQNARKARLDVENSQYRIEEVRARALPQVSGSGTISYNPILQLSALPGELVGEPGTTKLVAFGQKWNANAGASFSQTLFDQSVFTGLKAAKTTKEFYQLNVQLTEEQVIEQVATAYYRILVQRKQVGVLDSTIRNTRKVQEILQGQYNSGLARKIDVDRIGVSISNLETNRQQLNNGVTLLENQLKFLMGMPIRTRIVVAEASLDNIEPKIVGEDQGVDLSDRTELMLLRTQESLLNYQKQAYSAEYYPSLSLGGSYSYQGLSPNFPIFRGASDGANWFDVASFNLNLRIPLFNGFATRSRLRQAEISIKKLKEDISSTSLSLDLAYENALTEINNSVKTLAHQEKNVKLAEEVFFNTQNNYNNGLAPLTDLLSSENALTEAQNNYSSALLNYKVAEIQLLRAQGLLKTLIN